MAWVLTRSTLKGFFLHACTKRKNNPFLASQLLWQTKSSWWFRFSHHSLSKRNLYQATWRNEIKTVCSRTLEHKTHEEAKWRGLHWTCACSRVWKVSGGEQTLLRRHAGEVLPKLPQSSAPWCDAPACSGEQVFISWEQSRWTLKVTNFSSLISSQGTQAMAKSEPRSQ